MQLLSMLFISCSLLALAPQALSGVTCPTKCSKTCTTKLVQAAVQKSNYNLVVSLLKNADDQTVCDVVACLNDETLVGNLLFAAAEQGNDLLVSNILNCVCSLACTTNPAVNSPVPSLSPCLVVKNALIPALQDICCDSYSLAVEVILDAINNLGNLCQPCQLLGCALAALVKDGKPVYNVVWALEHYVFPNYTSLNYQDLICCLLTTLQDEFLGVGLNGLPDFIALFLALSTQDAATVLNSICLCIGETNYDLGQATLKAINALYYLVTSTTPSTPTGNYVQQQLNLAGKTVSDITATVNALHNLIYNVYLSECAPVSCFKATLNTLTPINVHFVASLLCNPNIEFDMYSKCPGAINDTITSVFETLFNTLDSALLAEAVALSAILCPQYVPEFPLINLCTASQTDTTIFISQALAAYEALKATRPSQADEINIAEDAFKAAVRAAESYCLFILSSCQKLVNALSLPEGGVEAACALFNDIKAEYTSGSDYCARLCHELNCLRCTPIIGDSGIIAFLVCALSNQNTAYNSCLAIGEDIITALCGCGGSNENEWTDLVTTVLTRLGNINATLPVNALTRSCDDILVP